MKLTRRAVTRPVFSTVIALLILVLGTAALLRLPVREYPDIDDPTVTVTVIYPGASAEVVEREVTEPIEESVSAIDGVRQIRSSSRDGRSRVSVQFTLARNLDLAAADVRDRISAVRNELPDDAEEPEVAQRSLEAQVIMWLVLTSESLDRLQLSDFADRVLIDELTTAPGVATVLFGGERRYALRIWLDLDAMAARGVTVLDVERALRARNLELPAGRLVSDARELTVRTMTELARPEDYRQLVIREQGDTQITLGEVARIRYGPENLRTAVRLNGEEAIGLGVVRQTGSNTLAVAEAVRDKLSELAPRIPDDISVTVAYDESRFISASIRQIVITLAITIGLVVAVVFLSLGSWRSTLVPAATIPSSVIAAFGVLYAFGFSVNVLTLLALILAIGMLIDDSIVVVENVFRHTERGSPQLVAADEGAGEVAFAVIATTLVLLAVITPLALLTGDAGRLFTEFAAALGGALAFSSLVALTLGVTIASKLIHADRIRGGRLYRGISHAFERAASGYARLLEWTLRARWFVIVGAVLLVGATWWLYRELPRELSPREDRGAIFIPIQGPEGATLEYMEGVLDQVEAILLPMTQGEDAPGELVISLAAPRSQGQGPVNSAIVIFRLKDWGEREVSQFEVTRQLIPRLAGISDAQAFAVNPPSLTGGGFQQPVQMVFAGDSVEQAYEYASQVMARAREVEGLAEVRLDYQPTSPQVQLAVDRRRAAELGITPRDIGRTLQILIGGEDITDFSIEAQTYEVMVRARPADRVNEADLGRIQIRSAGGELVPLASLLEFETVGRPAELYRTDRRPSVTLQASLAGGVALGEVLAELEEIARSELPQQARVSWLGVSQDYQRSERAFLVAFGLALVIVYLVLAAQFESFVQPVVLLAGVPLAVFGSLAAVALSGGTINIFSQIGLVLAIGLMAKNGILLVEFANQLRDHGQEFREALTDAARIRFRPIVMTSVATLFGAVPLALAVGPGAETRSALGYVIIGGVLFATLMALLLVPVLYLVLARHTQARGALARELEDQRNRGRREREPQSREPLQGRP
ncbi:MAG TPA: efflux RND transporter permease subunit [Steroidobacteraceae bacterium]|nr:efflux RND transporter permease subunit [Steroidobacteraceae bacterium]